MYFAVYERKDVTQASITPFSQIPQAPVDEMSSYAKSPGVDESPSSPYLLNKRKCRTPQPVPRKALFACGCVLLTICEPYVLNGLMHVMFEKTRALDINSLSGCLCELEIWLSCIDNANIKLGKGFDIKLLCRAVDAILNTDHLLMITKFLVILYEHSKVFSCSARLELFGNTLIEKHFTHLFLFWEDNVRTAYIQILLFKVLTRKRNVLLIASKKKADSQGQPAVNLDPNDVNLALFEMIESKVKAVKKLESEIETQEKERETQKKKSFSQYKKSRSVSLDFHGTKSRRIKKFYKEEDAGKEPHKPKPGHIPKNCYVYVTRAMEDYRKNLSRYEAWEKSGGPQPKLILYRTVSGGKLQATPVRSQSAPLGKM